MPWQEEGGGAGNEDWRIAATVLTQMQLPIWHTIRMKGMRRPIFVLTLSDTDPQMVG